MRLLKIVFVIVGAKIGAGFASGKEIFEYFAKYGAISLLFIIPLFFLFYIFVYICLKFGSSYKNFNLKLANKDLSYGLLLNNKRINLIDIFMFFTFLILCSAMFSGLVSLTLTYFPNINKILVLLMVTILSIIMIKISFTVLSRISYIIVPLIIIGIIMNALFTFHTNSFTTSFGVTNFLPLPALTILYASQNTFLASFVIIKSGSGLNNNQISLVSFLVSFSLCFLLVLGILCFLFNPRLAFSDIPFAEISMLIGPVFSYLFGFIILSSIITTYATTLASLKEFFNGEKKYNKPWVMLGLIVLLSLLNFGAIVKYLYPIIGVFGVVYIYKIYSKTKLSFKFFFNKTDNSIHKASKNT